MTPQTLNSTNDNILDCTNWVDRLGGTSTFNCVVMDICKQIQLDDDLQSVYGVYSLKGLMSFFHLFFTTIFDFDDCNKVGGSDVVQQIDDVQVNVIVGMHSKLLKKGLNESHFDMLVCYFESALQDAWVKDHIVNDATYLLKSFRDAFKPKNEEQEQHIYSVFEIANLEYVKERLNSEKATESPSSTKHKKKVLPARTRSGEGLLSMFRKKIVVE